MAKEKILVVDDEEAIVEILQEMFSQNEFFDVVTALNGKEALEKSQLENFQLICVDFRMPIMDGGTFARELRNFPGAKNRDVPIVFVTANPEQAEEVQKELPNIFILMKPILPTKLATIILRAIKSGIHMDEEK